jgi:acetoin utilization deacetylase AcuC-like enzyme
MGFCMFNSVAAGAAEALQHSGVIRVAVLDFDVHHGNGTVDIFRDTPEVLVCSSFQHPYYPNRQTDVQRPNIINTPLAAGTGSQAFRKAIERDWIPAVCAHRPDLILVSAGFDAHADDPLAGLELTHDDFAWVTGLIVNLADDFCGGRIVSALEGGYDLDALAKSTEAHVRVLNET